MDILKLFSWLPKTMKWARRKFLNLDKIDELQNRIKTLEIEQSELKIKVSGKDSALPPDATFISEFGIWFSKSKGLHYCASCASKNILAPLRVENDGWRCLVRECYSWIEKDNRRYGNLREDFDVNE